MNPATNYFRKLIQAGLTTRYPCPCHAEGTLTELEPGVFLANYEHELWCPVLSDPANN